MKVLIIGSGGREHALAWKCAQDNIVSHVFVSPGNAGTHLEEKVSNVEIDINNFSAIEDFCINESIKLVIIGPEQPLVEGLTNYLHSKNINTFGPSKEAAQLEGSKTFSKDFFVKYGIPTANLFPFPDNEKDALAKSIALKSIFSESLLKKLEFNNILLLIVLFMFEFELSIVNSSVSTKILLLTS